MHDMAGGFESETNSGPVRVLALVLPRRRLPGAGRPDASASAAPGPCAALGPGRAIVRAGARVATFGASGAA